MRNVNGDHMLRYYAPERRIAVFVAFYAGYLRGLYYAPTSKSRAMDSHGFIGISSLLMMAPHSWATASHGTSVSGARP